jgi:hypothetical protein
MDALERNHRSMIVATVVMIVITVAFLTLGMLLFPLSAYDDPSAGLIRGLINTPRGNIIIIAMFGVLAVNIGVFFNTITRLERERNALLSQNAQVSTPPPQVEGEKSARAVAPPQTDTAFKPTKK